MIHSRLTKQNCILHNWHKSCEVLWVKKYYKFIILRWGITQIFDDEVLYFHVFNIHVETCRPKNNGNTKNHRKSLQLRIANLLEIWCRFSTKFNRSTNLINTDYTSTKLVSLTQRCLLKVRVVSYKTFPQLITLTAMAFWLDF